MAYATEIGDMAVMATSIRPFFTLDLGWMGDINNATGVTMKRDRQVMHLFGKRSIIRTPQQEEMRRWVKVAYCHRWRLMATGRNKVSPWFTVWNYNIMITFSITGLLVHNHTYHVFHKQILYWDYLCKRNEELYIAPSKIKSSRWICWFFHVSNWEWPLGYWSVEDCFFDWRLYQKPHQFSEMHPERTTATSATDTADNVRAKLVLFFVTVSRMALVACRNIPTLPHIVTMVIVKRGKVCALSPMSFWWWITKGIAPHATWHPTVTIRASIQHGLGWTSAWDFVADACGYQGLSQAAFTTTTGYLMLTAARQTLNEVFLDSNRSHAQWKREEHQQHGNQEDFHSDELLGIGDQVVEIRMVQSLEQAVAASQHELNALGEAKYSHFRGCTCQFAHITVRSGKITSHIEMVSTI